MELVTKAVITEIDDRAGGVRVIALQPETPLRYRAGQFVRLSGGGFDARAYSIANRPQNSGKIVLHIRDFGSGLSNYLAALPRGAEVEIHGPFGTMDIEHARGRPVLMVAGGTGISPLLAMMQEIMRHGITDEGITLLYGARTPADIYCRPELEALLSTGEVTLHEAFGDETPDKLLSRFENSFKNHAVYLSGPSQMIEAMRNVLHTREADPARIFHDDWTTPKP
ncbi:MAG: hypothetical protein KGQ41_00375 [Alphaproteobacteria bacterium]|nr:hypothetical protein [Alphaproteobacteria bacterium]